MAKRMNGRCSFCGKSQEQVSKLIAGPGGVFICDECVRLCNEIIKESQQPLPPSGGGSRWRSITH